MSGGRKRYSKSDGINMKYLYIIGNGFDIFSGLKTRYVDFRFWLEHNYPFIYENLSDAYEMDGDWWNDFEQQLGELNVRRFVSKFNPCRNAKGSIVEQVENRRRMEEENGIPHLFYYNYPCARRLAGLLDVLQYCFEKWVQDIMKKIEQPQYTHIEKENSYFITFNYTDTLKCLYDIPDKRVLHIHGCASRHDRLVFGHNRFPHADIVDGDDAGKVCDVLNKYHKNPYEYILNHKELPGLLTDVDFVRIYGLSFSPVDEDYITWILSNTPETGQWEISWYSDTDKRRISDYILRHSSLISRYKLVQLQRIEDMDDKSTTIHLIYDTQ